MKNKEIIGYKLLKDLPLVKTGSIFQKENNFFITNSNSNTFFQKFEIEQAGAEWFEPIFEEETPDYSWENCFQKHGFYIHINSNIYQLIDTPCNNTYQNVFRTSKQAKSALAMAQLSHIIWVANGCEEIDWSDHFKEKYVLYRFNNHSIDYNTVINIYHFLAFKSIEIRDEVYKQNKKLIHDYLMID